MTRRDAAFIAILFFSVLGALFFGFLKPRPLKPVEKATLEARAEAAEEIIASTRGQLEEYKEAVEYSENLRLNGMEAPPPPPKPDSEALELSRGQAQRELLKVRSELIDRSMSGMFLFLSAIFLLGWIGARYLAGDLGGSRGASTSMPAGLEEMTQAIAEAQMKERGDEEEGGPRYVGDPYAALGLEETADEEEVRERYLKRLETVGGPQTLMSSEDFDHPGKDYAIKLNSAYKEICRRRGWAP